jgi:acyl dehydratase
MLYALGVGAGQDDPADELAFTTENSHGVESQVLPTFAVIVCAGGMPKELGSFDLAMLVHGGQAVELHQPLPTSGSLEVTSEIAAIHDKGSAAVVVLESRAVLAGTDDLVATTRSSLFIRGEGGWGGDRGPSAVSDRPEREPDGTVTYAVPLDQPLLYRLSGDRNPLHSDPSFATRAGFERPILHGLCTYGYTGRALLHACCGSDPARFASMDARFSKPVLPGGTLTVRYWIDGNDVTFETVDENGDVVLAAGRALVK